MSTSRPTAAKASSGVTDFQFDEATHTYTLDGEVLPSVTHIIRFLDVDVDKSRPWMRDAAAERGSAVHEATALIDYDEPDVLENVPYDYQGYVNAYLAFLNDYQPEWEIIERPMWSAYGSSAFAGTVDRYGTAKGRKLILDIKTGTSSAKARHSAQLTGYWLLLGCPDCDFGILYLRKDGTYKLQMHDTKLELWDACYTLNNALGGKAK